MEKEREINKCVRKWRKVYPNIFEMNRRVLCVRYIFSTKPTFLESQIRKIDEIIKGKPIKYYVFPTHNEFIAENLTTDEIMKVLRLISKIKPITYFSVTTPEDYLFWAETMAHELKRRGVAVAKPLKRTFEVGR